MDEHKEQRHDWKCLRKRIIGPRKESIRKRYCPELQRRISDLEESETKYRSLVENVCDLVWEVDKEYRFIYVSPRIRDYLGYEPEELLGRTPFELMSPEEALRVSQIVLPLVTTRQALPPYESTLLTRDGREVVFEVTARKVSDADGRFHGYRGTNRDITERRNAEKDLRESQRTLSTLMSNLPGMAYRCKNDADWTMIFVSEGALELTGYPPEALVGNSVIAYGDLIQPEDRSGVWDGVKAALVEKAPFQLSYRITTASGEAKSILEYGRGVYSDDGRLLALEGLMLDDTERKKAENDLKESEEKFRALAENAQALIIIVQESRYVYTNPYFSRLVGYGRDELMSMDATEMVHPEFVELVRERLWRRLRGEAVPSHYEFVVLAKNGDEIWLDYTAARIDYRGKPAIVGVGYDITERKRAESALLESEEKFRALAEHAEVAIFIVQNNKYVYTNPHNLALTGYTREELEGMDISRVIHPDSEELVLDRVRKRLLGEPVPSHYEFEILTKQGDERWIDYSGARIEFKGMPAIVGVAYDITERKIVVEALLESEEKFRALAENADAMIIIHQEERIVYANPYLSRLTGYSSEELEGMEVIRLIHPDSRALMLDRWRRRRLGETVPYHLEYKLLGRAGNEIWVDYSRLHLNTRASLRLLESATTSRSARGSTRKNERSTVKRS